MIVKTKRYALDKGVYTKTCFAHVLKSMWWVFLLPVAMIAAAAVTQIWWIGITALVITALYLLFWYIQFAGVSQMEQSKFIFDPMIYEITSQQILMKVDSKRGMPIQWDQIKTGKRTKDGISLFVSRAHLVHFPNRVFKTENEIKFVESIMKRKGLIA